MYHQFKPFRGYQMAMALVNAAIKTPHPLSATVIQCAQRNAK